MKSDLKVMKKNQFFHLRFKGEPHKKKCSRLVDPGDKSKGMESFIAIHEILPMGGATIYYCPAQNGKQSMIGISLCSDADIFCKKEGRDKSTGDIKKKLNAKTAIEKSWAKQEKYKQILDESGDWYFDRLLTSQETITFGMDMICKKVRRVVKRKMKILEEEKKETMDRCKKYLLGDLKIKPSTKKKDKQKIN